MLLFDLTIIITLIMFLLKKFNAFIFMCLISLSLTSFWMPQRWYDKPNAMPHIGEYDKYKGDTTYIYYATYNAESIVKRDLYLYHHCDEGPIKCVSLDDYYSLYIQDREEHKLDTYDIDIQFDNTCLGENFNWRWTIYKYNNNILVECY